ncbi:MAG: fatty acid desaturase [Woeseiaceae bacterium]|nr:fatty acid desaturase [Woeseiaceae bacterium]NIP21353.1 fatty acid desaturase [Woeseiaceae bacterium]NIS90320.1 fatty acid desaturase [Woeseiaceae bacterium]
MLDIVSQQAKVSSETGSEPRTGRELFNATTPFAIESVRRSWWLVGSTFVMLILALVGAAFAPVWPLRLFFSVVSALLLVRAFITYHDYMHNAILQRSRFAWILFRAYAVFALTPPRSWKKSHNYHHGHVGKICGPSVGAFAIMTTDMWSDASRASRAAYRIERHPLTVVTGYLTIFLFSITLLPLIREPSRHWDALLVLLGHGTLITLLWLLGGFETAFFVVLLPMTIASMIGSYMFYAQHSFEDMHILSEENWTYYRAAMESSSYMKLNRLMRWFTGNIGYHHIHHLNVRIPFYRLPEAMSAIPELQSPATTTLSFRDIRACFRCCLWDPELQRMVSYREAAKAA